MQQCKKTNSILPEFEAAYKLLNTIAATYNISFESVRKCEDEENDIRHAYELSELTYKERAKLATRQAQVLRERRKHKDTLEIIEPLYTVMQTPEGIAFMKKLHPAIGESRKAERSHNNRAYHSRTDTVKNTLKKEGIA